MSGRIQPSGQRRRPTSYGRAPYVSLQAGRGSSGRCATCDCERPLPSQPRKIDRLVFVERPVHGGQRIFEAARTIKQYGALVTPDAAVGEALLVRRIGSAT